MVEIGKASCKGYIVAGSRIQNNLVACVAEASGTQHTFVELLCEVTADKPVCPKESSSYYRSGYGRLTCFSGGRVSGEG